MLIGLGCAWCREKLGRRMSKLESQLAAATERAQQAEAALAAVQSEGAEELRRLRQETEHELVVARQAAAAARQQMEQQSARWVPAWPCLPCPAR
jgi:uncharacterized protein involved in exopolysaccharide biosynthesis